MWKFIVISLLALFVVYLWKIFCSIWVVPRRMEKELRKRGFKGNSYKFLYGDTIEITNMYKEANSKPIGLHDDIVPRVYPFINKIIKTYGKMSFAWIGTKPVIYVTDPALVRETLTNYTTIHKNFRFPCKIYKLLQGGIVAFEPKKWSTHRQKYNHAFYLERMKDMFPSVRDCCDNIMIEWKNKLTNGSGVLDVFQNLKDYNCATISRGLFRQEYNDEMRQCFRHLKCLATMSNNANNAFDFPGKRFVPIPTLRKAEAIEAEIRKTFTKMINERIKNRKAGLIEAEYHDLFDLFIDELYDEENKEKEIDVESIVDDAIGNMKLFHFAGEDTSLNSIVWVLINLAIHPEWQTRAREEVYRVMGDRKTIQPDDINNLKIVRMIINEVFRLYTPGIEFTRGTRAETKLGDYNIPEGVLLQIPLVMMHRDPEIWGEDAHMFKPERFAQGKINASKGEFAFIPFGYGPRICIAQNFALLQIRVFIVTFLRTFTWELSPEYTHAPHAAFTLEAQYGAPLILHEIN